MNKRYTLATLLACAASMTGRADVRLNENFSVGGYVVGSYTVTDPDTGPSTDHMGLDAVKTSFTGSFKPVTGTVSLFYPGPGTSDITILDAFATYDIGSGSSITAGKFLSYLGYEAFDPVNMTQISYAPVTAGTLATIPAYHSGVRYDYSDKAFSLGAALVDSVNAATIYKGDGELKENQGFELYGKFTGVPNFTAFLGYAYDTQGNATTGFPPAHSISVWDFWTEYKLGASTTLAGEYATKDGGTGIRGDSWLLFVNQAFTPTFSTVFRIGAQSLSNSTVTSTGTDDYEQYTIAPTWKINENFAVRAEYSYYDMAAGAAKNFFGVQGVFKF